MTNVLMTLGDILAAFQPVTDAGKAAALKAMAE